MRMIQAVVTTWLVLSRAVVRDMVSGPAAASRISHVTMGMAVVQILVPILGGALDQLWGWGRAMAAAGGAALAGYFLVPGAGATPLLVIMGSVARNA